MTAKTTKGKKDTKRKKTAKKKTSKPATKPGKVPRLSDLGEGCTSQERSDIRHGLTMLADKYEKIAKSAEDMGDESMRATANTRKSTIINLRSRFGDNRTLAGLSGTPMGDAAAAPASTDKPKVEKPKDEKPAKKKDEKKGPVVGGIHPVPKPSQQK